MSVIRTIRFTLDPAKTEEMLKRRSDLIDATRTAFAGPDETRLVRIDDETWVDAWRWRSPEALRAALAGAPRLPEAAAAFALVGDASAEEGELVDEDIWAL